MDMKGDFFHHPNSRSDRTVLEEDYYLNTISDEDLCEKKARKVIHNKCSYILQSLEGKTINITALDVDIVNSSEKVKTLSDEVAGEYYQAFLENASDLIEHYGGYVLKNVGDCVIGFFPCSKYYIENHDKAVLCGLAMHDMIKDSLNPYFIERKLPSIECRISADFGAAKVIRISSNGDYSAIDLFGSAMNSAAKISHYAKPGQMVVGENLLRKLINSTEFEFKLINRFGIRNNSYAVYLVEHR
ncbi:MAG: class 3 adenylate cyclase [Candidatus Nitrosomirales archaeon]|jgi:class 3 adenylate cyclase